MYIYTRLRALIVAIGLSVLLHTGAMAAPQITGPGSIRDLGQAVASVNDWRAILIIVTFVMLTQMAGSSLQRWFDRKAIDRLANAMNTLSEEVSKSTTENMLYQARTQSVLDRVEPLLHRLEAKIRVRETDNGDR